MFDYDDQASYSVPQALDGFLSALVTDISFVSTSGRS
jgi:hypothetical protein